MTSQSDRQPEINKRIVQDNDSKERLSDLRVTGWFLGSFLLVGLIVVSLQHAGARLPSLLWALAWVAVGDVIGFLFGIPRVLQQADAKPAPGPRADATAATSAATQEESTSYRQQVNTNLEQISDWLTKIIVGIGLVELRRLPELLSRVSSFMAAGLGTDPRAQVLAAGIVIYFSILGFLSGYLVTRIYLSGAFRRADTGNVLVGGIATPIASLFQQLYKAVTEIRELIAIKTVPPIGAVKEATTASINERKIRSVLWVDDYPENNSLMIGELTKSGMAVVLTRSTAGALSKLRSESFDTIITDMGRDAEGPAAGLELVREVRMVNQETPIIIYCSRKSAQKFHDEAVKAGATAITSSEIELRQLLQLDL